jgi:hypothetical protein
MAGQPCPNPSMYWMNGMHYCAKHYAAVADEKIGELEETIKELQKGDDEDTIDFDFTLDQWADNWKIKP